MANQIVHEALEFVRPIRLQVEHTAIADVLQNAVSLAETKVPRRDIGLEMRRRRRAAADSGRPSPALPAVHESADQRLRSARRHEAPSSVTAREGVLEEDAARRGRRRRYDAHRGGGSRRQRTRRARRSCAIAFSTRSSRPSRRVPASAWRSSARSSTRTTAASTFRPARTARASGSRCRYPGPTTGSFPSRTAAHDSTDD